MTEEDFWSILRAMPESHPVFYRLYYDDVGLPIIYSMEDLSGNYIEVDRETYVLASFNIRVVDNKLVHTNPVAIIKKLQPTDLGGTACDPCDVCIVVEPDQPHTKWTIVNNEIN
jgi:hypothetical protein